LNAGLVGLYSGDVGENFGDVGEPGEYCGEVGEYSWRICGDVGLYSGEVGPMVNIGDDGEKDGDVERFMAGEVGV
jgi:hypothetical protein